MPITLPRIDRSNPETLQALKTRLLELSEIKLNPNVAVFDLNAPTNARLLSNVNRLIAGEAPVVRSVERDLSDVGKALNEHVEFAKDRIAQDQAALANRTDFRGLSQKQIAAEQRAGADRNKELQDRIAVVQGNLQVFSQAFPDAGIELPKAPVRLKSGFVPAEEAPKQGARGRLGAPLETRKLPDGTWGIFKLGETDLIEGGFSSQIIADQAATQLNLGSRKIGDPEPVPLVDAKAREAELAKERGLVGGESVLTDGQKAEIETIASSAAENFDLLSLLELSDADVARFLQTATDEAEPFFKQVFTRASEDFESGLQLAADLRELELQKEEAQLQSELEETVIQSAEAGLATSGIRARMEQRIMEREENLSRTSRLEFEEKARSLGRKAEEQLGTRTLAASRIAELHGSPIFTLAEDVRGETERERETVIQTRRAELERQARLRSLAAVPGAEVAIDDLVSLF